MRVATRLTGRRIHAVVTLRLPLSAGAAWGQMRHFSSFVSLDPFHAGVRSVDGSSPSKPGDRVILGHRFGPIGFDRFGRILKWREGRGYSFSDLSAGDPRRGFPHVFTYDLRPRGEGSSRLTISVRGHWTAQWLPAWVTRRWFAWVLGHTAHAMRNRMLRVAIHREAFVSSPPVRRGRGLG